MRKKTEQKLEQFEDFLSQDFTPNEQEALQDIIISALANQEKISPSKLKTFLKNNTKKKEFNGSIPLCIFNQKPSPFEAIVKYLKEEFNLKYHEIAKLTNRDQRSIWYTYKQAIKKQEQSLTISPSPTIPITIINNRTYSVLSSIVKYLKEEHKLRYCDIAKHLGKDERTIWTCYKRTQ